MYIFVAIKFNKIKYNMADNIDKEFEHHDKVFSIFLDSLFSSGDPKGVVSHNGKTTTRIRYSFRFIV